VCPKFKRIVIHGPPTLPRDGELVKYFSQNHGVRIFHGTARRHAFAAKNLALPQEKLRAFSLPHGSQVLLMFGAARFDEPVLSVSRSLEFYIVP
jgi:hypothetical protein